MKILTITCHRPHNYGAVLQTFALNHYLRASGYDARVIDYTSKSHGGISDKYKNNPFAKIIRSILLIPDKLKGKNNFGKFLNNFVKLTEKPYFSYQELLNDPPVADVYITGSDQVWNCEIPTGNDDAYFLSFALPNSKKISYAASMALETLSEEQKKRYFKLLKDFHSISVRETSSINILKSIGLNGVTSVLDPVFLLDKQEWADLAETTNYKERYVLVYGFNRQKNVFDFAKKIAKQKKMKVYSVNTRWLDILNCTDRYFWSVSPNEFISLIKNAEIVITNSFHGISFSIIFEKEFYAFTKGKTGNSRMKDLLKSLNLDSRLTEYGFNSLMEPIDYKAVETILSKQKDQAKEFIKNNLV